MPWASRLLRAVTVRCDQETSEPKWSLYRPWTTTYRSSPEAMARRIVRGFTPKSRAASEMETRTVCLSVKSSVGASVGVVGMSKIYA